VLRLPTTERLSYDNFESLPKAISSNPNYFTGLSFKNRKKTQDSISADITIVNLVQITMLSKIMTIPTVKIYLNLVKDLRAQLPKLAPWAVPGAIFGKLM
jgi:hypothetical protein